MPSLAAFLVPGLLDVQAEASAGWNCRGSHKELGRGSLGFFPQGPEASEKFSFLHSCSPWYFLPIVGQNANMETKHPSNQDIFVTLQRQSTGKVEAEVL